MFLTQVLQVRCIVQKTMSSQTGSQLSIWLTPVSLGANQRLCLQTCLWISWWTCELQNVKFCSTFYVVSANVWCVLKLQLYSVIGKCGGCCVYPSHSLYLKSKTTAVQGRSQWLQGGGGGGGGGGRLRCYLSPPWSPQIRGLATPCCRAYPGLSNDWHTKLSTTRCLLLRPRWIPVVLLQLTSPSC